MSGQVVSGSTGTPVAEAPADTEAPAGTGMRHCTVLALSALAGCLVLIGALAAVVVTWSYQPLLAVGVGLALGWVGVRLAVWLFSAPDAG